MCTEIIFSTATLNEILTDRVLLYILNGKKYKRESKILWLIVILT